MTMTKWVGKFKIDSRALTRWFPLKKLPLPPQPLDISFCWGGESFGGDGVRQASDLEAAGDLVTAFGLTLFTFKLLVYF